MDVIIVRSDAGKHFNKFGEEVISCRLCGEGTTMLGTKLCDGCWELSTRIERDPEIARRVLLGNDLTLLLDRLAELADVVDNGAKEVGPELVSTVKELRKHLSR